MNLLQKGVCRVEKKIVCKGNYYEELGKTLGGRIYSSKGISQTILSTLANGGMGLVLSNVKKRIKKL